MTDDVLRNALAEQNAVTFLADGPRLSTKYHVWVEARDRELGWVLLGGLGGCGVGQMWYREEPRHMDYPGYFDAPEQSSVGGFGTEPLFKALTVTRSYWDELVAEDIARNAGKP